MSINSAYVRIGDFDGGSMTDGTYTSIMPSTPPTPEQIANALREFKKLDARLEEVEEIARHAWEPYNDFGDAWLAGYDAQRVEHAAALHALQESFKAANVKADQLKDFGPRGKPVAWMVVTKDRTYGPFGTEGGAGVMARNLELSDPEIVPLFLPATYDKNEPHDVTQLRDMVAKGSVMLGSATQEQLFRKILAYIDTLQYANAGLRAGQKIMRELQKRPDGMRTRQYDVHNYAEDDGEF